MFNRKKIVTFTRISQFLKSIDSTSGVFLLWNPKKKKTIKEYIFKITLARLLFMFSFLMLSSLFVTGFDVLTIILGFSVSGTVLGLCTTMILLMQKKDVVKDLLKWCENIYDIEKQYHKNIHSIAETQLKKMENLTAKFLKWLRLIMYIDSVGFILGFVIIGLFLPEKIHPKFSLPVPFYLPFKNQKNYLSFVCTILFETIIVIDTATITIFLFGFAVTFFIHILGFLDIIQQAAEKIKDETKLFKQPSLNIKTVSDVTATLMQSQSLSFDDWMKMLNEMLCNVNSVIISAGKFYAIPFLLNELAGLGSLFICGLLFTVVRDQYFFAVGITIGSWLLFIICFINEKILEKFESINETLYDIPWYNLTTRQIKSLMLLMHCDKIQGGLTAAKIHYLTFERFGIIVKAGYTNMLVLKDIVQK